MKTSLAGSVQLKIDKDDRSFYTGNLRSKELEINPLELYENPLQFEDVEVDFILEPEPFNLEVQQLSVKDPLRDLVSWRQDRLFQERAVGRYRHN